MTLDDPIDIFFGVFLLAVATLIYFGFLGLPQIVINIIAGLVFISAFWTMLT